MEEGELIITGFVVVFFNDMVVSVADLIFCSFDLSFSPLFTIRKSLIPPEFFVLWVVCVLNSWHIPSTH